MEDSLEDEEAHADDESEKAPIAPPSKEKLWLKLKKKPGQKGISIHEPAALAAPRATIDMTHLVVEKPLASKPPLQAVQKELHSEAIG